MFEFFGFLFQSFVKPQKLLFQIAQKPQGGHFAGCGNHIICGLPAVYIVIGMDNMVIAFFASQDFDGTVGNYFVCIHIQRSAGAALNGIHNEIPMKFSRKNFITGKHHGLGLSFI